jgi:hypothetical protein
MTTKSVAFSFIYHTGIISIYKTTKNIAQIEIDGENSTKIIAIIYISDEYIQKLERIVHILRDEIDGYNLRSPIIASCKTISHIFNNIIREEIPIRRDHIILPMTKPDISALFISMEVASEIYRVDNIYGISIVSRDCDSPFDVIGDEKYVNATCMSLREKYRRHFDYFDAEDFAT